MRTCAKCAADISGRHGNARYCNSCSLDSLWASMRCSRKVNNAIRAGGLPAASSLDCEDCGERAEVYDHRDYSRPLAVAAVCESCNRRRGPAVWRREPATDTQQQEAA